jgi:hypothetical protein
VSSGRPEGPNPADQQVRPTLIEEGGQSMKVNDREKTKEQPRNNVRMRATITNLCTLKDLISRANGF